MISLFLIICLIFSKYSLSLTVNYSEPIFISGSTAGNYVPISSDHRLSYSARQSSSVFTIGTKASEFLIIFGGYTPSSVQAQYSNELFYSSNGVEYHYIAGCRTNPGGFYNGYDKFGYPTARFKATTFKLSNNEVYLFGGSGTDSAGNFGVMNDLFILKYSDLTNFIKNSQDGPFIWLAGSNLRSNPGQLPGGYKLVGYPSARMAATSISKAGSALFYGGDVASDVGELFRDVWRFDGKNFYWLVGSYSKFDNWAGSYPSNYDEIGIMPSRSYSMGWFSSDGRYGYLFGGYGGYSALYLTNSLWMTDLSDGDGMIWRWIGGSDQVVDPYAGTTYPSGRVRCAIASTNMLYENVAKLNSPLIFGGSFSNGNTNELWTYIGSRKFLLMNSLVSGFNRISDYNGYNEIGYIGSRSEASLVIFKEHLYIMFGYGTNGMLSDVFRIQLPPDDDMSLLRQFIDLLPYLGGSFAFVFLLILAVFLIGRRKKIKQRPLILLIIFFTFYDLITDIFFTIQISYNEQSNVIHDLFIVALVSLAVSFVFNIFVSLKFFYDQLHKNTAFLRWYESHSVILACLILFSSTNLSLLKLLYSGILNFDIFNCPLSVTDTYRLNSLSIIMQFTEDIPQLIIQIIYASFVPVEDWPLILLLSLFGTILAILFGFTNRILNFFYVSAAKSEDNRKHSAVSVELDLPPESIETPLSDISQKFPEKAVPTDFSIRSHTNPYITNEDRVSPRKPTIPNEGRISPRKPTVPNGGRISPRKPTVPNEGRISPRKPTIPNEGRISPRKPTAPSSPRRLSSRRNY